MKKLVTLLVFLLLSVSVYAESFDLPYRKENKWVAKEDNASLKKFLNIAKQKKLNHFYVQMPKEKRSLSIQRLLILRDILEKSLNTTVIIEEIPNGTVPPNHLLISTELPQS